MINEKPDPIPYTPYWCAQVGYELHFFNRNIHETRPIYSKIFRTRSAIYIPSAITYWVTNGRLHPKAKVDCPKQNSDAFNGPFLIFDSIAPHIDPYAIGAMQTISDPSKSVPSAKTWKKRWNEKMTILKLTTTDGEEILIKGLKRAAPSTFLLTLRKADQSRRIEQSKIFSIEIV